MSSVWAFAVVPGTTPNKTPAPTTMQTNEAAPPRKDANDLDLDAAVTGVVQPVCERLGLRQYVKGQHLHAVMLDMVALDSQGANEAELVAYGLALLDLARTLKAAHQVDERVLERQRLDADLADDHLNGIIAIEGETATMLEARAAAREKAAALNVAAARSDRRRARQLRTTRATARQRFNLGASA